MKKIISTILVSAIFVFASYGTKAQTNSSQATASIQVLQFHLEHRCYSCLKIEKFTKATLAKHFPSLSLTLVNVEDKKNGKMAEQFEAAGSALFLYNPATGKKTNLTQFAFMNVGDQEKFDAGLKKQIEDFLKS
ncbi:MAG: nitrophenyl compound nitroreductase subunit ArsF family protein [Flavisolibacter sp.]